MTSRNFVCGLAIALSSFGCFPVRHDVVYEGKYGGKPMKVVKRTLFRGESGVHTIVVEEKDRIYLGTLTTDEGKRITVNRYDFSISDAKK